MYSSAKKHGLNRVALISSIQAMNGKKTETEFCARHRVVSKNIYGLTKACQEVIAETFFNSDNIETAAFRIGYVIDGASMTDKYDRNLSEFEKGMIDRFDIGIAIKNSFDNISFGKLGFKVFFLDGGTSKVETGDVDDACRILNWQPKFFNDNFDAFI
ncbi:hypothetical protein AAEX28_09555 [Lentisphaerota bacterium WC36G]